MNARVFSAVVLLIAVLGFGGYQTYRLSRQTAEADGIVYCGSGVMYVGVGISAPGCRVSLRGGSFEYRRYSGPRSTTHIIPMEEIVVVGETPLVYAIYGDGRIELSIRMADGPYRSRTPVEILPKYIEEVRGEGESAVAPMASSRES